VRKGKARKVVGELFSGSRSLFVGRGDEKTDIFTEEQGENKSWKKILIDGRGLRDRIHGPLGGAVDRAYSKSLLQRLVLLGGGSRLPERKTYILGQVE